MKKKELWSLLLCLALLISPMGCKTAHAAANTTLQLSSAQYLAIDSTDSTKICFYTDANKTTLAGTLQVKLRNSPDYLIPVVFPNGTGAEYDFGNDNLANVSVELNPNNETNYSVPGEYNFGSNPMPLSGTRFDLSIAGGTTGVLELDFVLNAPSNEAPTASNVSMRGSFRVGETLTGHYTYSDAEGDTEGTSTFKWYRSESSDGAGKAAIAGANAKTYVLASADEGKYISFEVTPVAATGTAQGTAVESSTVGTIAPATVETPVLSPAGGTFTSAQNVTLSCATAGATIYYTTNGNDPTEADTPFAAGTPIAVTSTTTIKATAFKSGMAASETASATYTIQAQPPATSGDSDSYPTLYQQLGAPGGELTGNGLRFVSSGAYHRFESVWVDGSFVAPAHYILEPGSTIVTLRPAYLATLANGAHTLRINFADGYTKAAFTTPVAMLVPKTGGAVSLLPGALLLLAAGVFRKKV